MAQSSNGTWKICVACIVVGVIIAFVDSILKIGNSAALIITLVFWVSAVEGCIALAAAVESATSPWIKPIKRHLFAFHPLLLMFALLFLGMIPKMNMYPWATMENKWLSKNFFVTRNVIQLFIMYLLAKKYSIESLKESHSKNFWSVVYLFGFVISQSLVAFDWVMSLEYPWVSTLLGGFFFTESIYMGISIGAILIYFITRGAPQKLGEYKNALRDLTYLMLGFSVIWVGFFFAQFLTIWYGHLPEESVFFIKRLEMPNIRILMYTVIVLLWVIPFFSLIYKRIKSIPAIVSILSIVILTGSFLEKVVFIAPVVHIDYGVVTIEFIAMLVLFIIVGKQSLSTSSN